MRGALIPPQQQDAPPATAGRTVLHVGDFRYDAAMAAHPAVRSLPMRGRRLDVLYLDTTYCDPKWAPPLPTLHAPLSTRPHQPPPRQHGHYLARHPHVHAPPQAAHRLHRANRTPPTVLARLGLFPVSCLRILSSFTCACSDPVHDLVHH